MGYGGLARREKYRDQRRENGEGKAAKFGVSHRESGELLTVIHNPRQALFSAFFRQNQEIGQRQQPQIYTDFDRGAGLSLSEQAVGSQLRFPKVRIRFC
jgi:hypothetical protein